MSTSRPDGPLPMPAAYSELLKRLELPFALEAVHRSLTRAFDLDAKQHSDHDESLLRVLLCIRLAPEGAMRAKDISVEMLKSTSHISRLIDRAVARGLVERRTDPSDRRAHRVALTPQGEAEIDAYVPRAVAMLDQAFGDALNPDELRTAIGLLERIETTVLEMVTQREATRRD